MHEQPLTLAEFVEADEAFLTGTTKEILPIREHDRRRIGPNLPDPITKRISELFSEYTRDQNRATLRMQGREHEANEHAPKRACGKDLSNGS